MKNKPLFLFLAAIVLSCPARAADMPVYPIDSRCQAHWQTDAKMKNVCIQQQQASQSALEALWTSISDEIAQHCLGEWGKANDYVMLHFCVEQQVQAAKKAAEPDPE